jgi:LuxR family maltose regulon positive regulatory protein
LIRTKLAAPRLRPEHLERGHLLALLVDGSQRVTLLDAPAGYGKTTLLAAWQRADARRPFAWISLDEADADPGRFWSYVGAAVTGSPPAVQADVSVEEGVIPRLVNAIAAMARPLVLALEDYHRLGDSAVHDQLALLLERAPPTLQVVISTRAAPSLALARLRASGELVELGTRDLRFDAVEAATLLNDRLALGLDEPGIRRLVDRTDGWPAGLYLAGLALAESSDRQGELERFANGERHVMDYFMAEVLGDRSPEERALLRRAAILSEISGPLLDDMLDTHGSAARLRHLERSNLLLHRLEGDGEWFRFHAIFGRLLHRLLLEEEPDAAPELHRRASGWYAAHDIPARAIEHALAGGRPAAAAELIAAEWQPLAGFVESRVFAGWLAALPEEEIAADPRLALAAAWTAGWGGMEGSWSDWLDRVNPHHEPVELPLGLPSVEAGAVLTRAVFSFNEVGAHLEAARDATARFRDIPALRMVADGSLGVALYHAGLLGEARDHLAANVERIAADFPSGLVPALSYLSLTFTAAGEANEGLLCAESARDRIPQGPDPQYGSSHGLVHLAAGAALRALARPALAIAELDLAIERLTGDTLLLDLAQARIERALTLLATGRSAAAGVELIQAEAVLEGSPDPGALGTRLREASARVSEAARRPGSAGAPLSERELEILALLPGELSRREIAAALFVSFNTIQTHLRSIYRKLGVTSRAQAVGRAREQGLLEREAPVAR